MNPADREKLTALVGQLTAEGLSARVIAAQLGISDQTVQKYRKAQGISLRDYRAVTAEETTHIRQLCADGLRISEIARATGRSFKTIKKHLGLR